MPPTSCALVFSLIVTNLIKLTISVIWTEQKFIQNTAFLDLTCTTATHLDFGTTLSSSQCSFQCNKNTSCNSFFYNSDSGACEGVPVIYTDVCGDRAFGNKYYAKGI